MGVSETIYSTKSDPMSNPKHYFEIDTWSHEQSQCCSEIDTRSPSNRPRCSWNRHTIPRRTWKALIPLIRPPEEFQTISDTPISRDQRFNAESITNHKARTQSQGEKVRNKWFNEVRQLATFSGQNGEDSYLNNWVTIVTNSSEDPN